MKTINFLLCSILVCLSFFLSRTVVVAEEAPPVTAPAVTATPAAPVATADEAAAQQTLRAYLQMQDQLHATQRAIEESRKENEAASKRNAEAIGARLTVIEQSLAVQRQRALESTQNSNRILLLLVGTLAGIAVLAMICTAWFPVPEFFFASGRGHRESACWIDQRRRSYASGWFRPVRPRPAAG